MVDGTAHTVRGAAGRAAVAVLCALLVMACGGGSTSSGTTSESAAPATASSVSTAASTTTTGHGPTSTLSLVAPAAPRARIPFDVFITVDPPLTIVAPDGNPIPGTGHFHIFIERPALPPGAFTPQQDGIVHSITSHTRVPGLPAGTHTLTAAVANGEDRIVADPPAVSVTVVAT